MQLRTLMDRSDSALLHQLALAVPLTVAVVVVVRLVWVYPAAYLPHAGSQPVAGAP